MNRYERMVAEGKVKSWTPPRLGLEITRWQDLQPGDHFVWRKYAERYGVPMMLYRVTDVPANQLGSVVKLSNGVVVSRHTLKGCSFDNIYCAEIVDPNEPL